MTDFPQPNSCYCFDDNSYGTPRPDSVLPSPKKPDADGNTGEGLWCDCNEICADTYGSDDTEQGGRYGLCCPNTNSCVCAEFDDIRTMTWEEVLNHYCDDPMGRCCMWLDVPVLDKPTYRGCRDTLQSECTIRESDLGMHSPGMQKYILEWFKYEFSAYETCLSAPCVEEETMKCCESCRYDFPAGTFPDYIHSGKVKNYEPVYYKTCYENMNEERCDRLLKLTNPINPTSLPPGFEDFEDIAQYFNHCTTYSFSGSKACEEECGTGWYDELGYKLE